MAQLESKTKVSCSIALTLTEEEARALHGLASYSAEGILKVLYEHVGQHYIKPHANGLITLLTSARDILPTELGKIDAARKALAP